MQATKAAARVLGIIADDVQAISDLCLQLGNARDYAGDEREVGETEEVVAMASLPLATLDRDELNFHVERLLLVSTELGGKKRKGRRVKN